MSSLKALLVMALFVALSTSALAQTDDCGQPLIDAGYCGDALPVATLCLSASTVWTIFYTSGNYTFTDSGGGKADVVAFYYEDDDVPGTATNLGGVAGPIDQAAGAAGAVTFNLSSPAGISASSDCKVLFAFIPPCSVTSYNETLNLVEGAVTPIVPCMSPTPTPIPCQFISCSGDVNGVEPCLTCTPAAPTVTPTQLPTDTPTASPSPTATPCSSCTGAGPITRKPQGGGEAWADDAVPYGAKIVVTGSGDKTNTMKWIGCLITCFSMVDSSYDPGGLDAEVTAENDFADTAGDLNVRRTAEDLGYSYTLATGSDSNIEDALCGNPPLAGANFIIARVNSEEHYVVITGQGINPLTGQCDFTIADPAKADDLYLGDYGGAEYIYALQSQ